MKTPTSGINKNSRDLTQTSPYLKLNEENGKELRKNQEVPGWIFKYIKKELEETMRMILEKTFKGMELGSSAGRPRDLLVYLISDQQLIHYSTSLSVTGMINRSMLPNFCSPISFYNWDKRRKELS